MADNADRGTLAVDNEQLMISLVEIVVFVAKRVERALAIVVAGAETPEKFARTEVFAGHGLLEGAAIAGPRYDASPSPRKKKVICITAVLCMLLLLRYFWSDPNQMDLYQYLMFMDDCGAARDGAFCGPRTNDI